jgi:hypothetical protein
MHSILPAQPSSLEEKLASPDAPSDETLSHSKKDVESRTSPNISGVFDNERDLVTHVISVADDPSLNPWTFRSFLIGLSLSTFGSVLGKH